MHSLGFLVWLEQFRSPLTDALFIGASWLGNEEAYLIILTVIYLCIGHRFGFHLLVMFLLSSFLNAELKEIFGTERPYVLHPDEVHPLYLASGGGYAYPSGHAQNAAVVWGIIAIRQATWRQRAIPLALIVLIGLSRLYCQVHWPVDVVGGLMIGGMLVVAYLIVAGAWQTSGLELGPWRTAWLAIIAAVAMTLLGGHIKTCVQSAGALLGAGLGFALLEARGGYKAQAPLPTQVLKVAVALAVLFGVRAGSKLVLGSLPGATHIRYAMIGFTCTYLLPMAFAGFHNWRLRARKAMDEVPEGVGEES